MATLLDILNDRIEELVKENEDLKTQIRHLQAKALSATENKELKENLATRIETIESKLSCLFKYMRDDQHSVTLRLEALEKSHSEIADNLRKKC